MESDKKKNGCASSSASPFGEQHVEVESMHSSFKGPPDPGTNRPVSEGYVSGYGYLRESSAGISEGGEENLDVSVHRGLEELSNQASEGAVENSGEALLLREPNSRASSSAHLRPPGRSSTSSDDDFERLNVPPDINQEVVELRRRLRESEMRRQELEEALRLAESKNKNPAAREDSRGIDESATAEWRMKEMEERLHYQDLKLDAKRRDILRLRNHLRTYEKDFISLNDRARAAEEMLSRYDVGLSRSRDWQYARNLGLHRGRETHLLDLDLYADREAEREAQREYNEAHNRIADSYSVSRSHPRPPSPDRDDSSYEYVPPRPGYCRLEVDGGDACISQSDSSSALSESGSEVTCPTDDLEQLVEETERRTKEEPDGA